MTKVSGEFTAILPVPIVTESTILNLMNRHRSPGLNVCIDESDVRVQLEGQTEPVLNEQGEVDLLPGVSSFKVWVTRDVPLSSNSEGRTSLSIDEERRFEGVLIEAVRRVISAIKMRTRQSSLDTRHPVHSYDYQYHRADQPVGTMFPLRQGFYRMPEYALGTISLSEPFNRELDTRIWESVRTEVTSPVEVPLYDELLHDAVMFQRDMHYQMAALSAAISLELVLARICAALLVREGNLHQSQVTAIIRGRRPMDLVGIIRALDPNVPISYKGIQTVFEERNRIVHGHSRDTSADLAASMIATSRRVREMLSSLEDLR